MPQDTVAGPGGICHTVSLCSPGSAPSPPRPSIEKETGVSPVLLIATWMPSGWAATTELDGVIDPLASQVSWATSTGASFEPPLPTVRTPSPPRKALNAINDPATATDSATTPAVIRRLRSWRRRVRSSRSNASGATRTRSPIRSRRDRRSRIVVLLKVGSERRSRLGGERTHGDVLHAEDPAGLLGAVAEELGQHDREALALWEPRESPSHRVALVGGREGVAARVRTDRAARGS